MQRVETGLYAHLYTQLLSLLTTGAGSRAVFGWLLIYGTGD